MGIYIGIDSGTQSVKAVALDLESGEVVSEARAPHDLIPGLPPGHMEQDPRQWTDALRIVLRAIAGKIPVDQVKAIGVSGQQHGFVPLDSAGEVIRPAKLWCDTSTVAECELLTKKLGGAKSVIRHTGNVMLPGYTAPKILWLKRHEPQNFRRLRHVLLPHDYLNFFLTGNYFMEPGDASGTALFDVKRRNWSTAAVRAIDPKLASWLPPISESDQAAGTLLPNLADEFGFPRATLVSAGGGDNMMGAIGTGNVAPGIVSASFGTSGTIYGYSAQPVIDPTGEIAAFCSSSGGWLPLLCTMNVTTVTEQVRGLFGADHDKLDELVSSASAGAGGLMLLPYLLGERTPNVPDGSGVMVGLRATNSTPAALARAAMEGVTLGMNYGLQRLRTLGLRPREIRVTGGGARSSVWRQMMADIFGVPVVGMIEEEGAALGGALQAAWCESRRAGKKIRLRDLTARVVRINENSRAVPDVERVRQYRGLQQLHDDLGRTLRPFFQRHRQWVKS